MFAEQLNRVTERVRRELQGSNSLDLYLSYSTRIWCEELDINKDVADYILRGYRQHEITELTNYIYQEWEQKQEEEKDLLGWFKGNRKISQLYSLAVFNLIKGRNENVRFIIIIAFCVTAIGYFIYKLNQQKRQQTTYREDSVKDNSNYLASGASTVQNSSIQIINKQFLVLVVSASQTDFVESLAAKGRIDFKDGESLYEITKYLWLGSENEFSQRVANIDRYAVSKGKESEYDIYLVYIELNQADERFRSNVNQLDRYDAFRKLADLAVDLKISSRLQMEAYENIGVYNR
ncbi:hypothetical protein [Floridanema evergladense]|uniref:Uncharacterized protein n=1 Tax=Floridaenema evergladense BLCC-F167 TaxID=3153639 RepID=A0ABV4WVY4_9CYAN